MRSQKEGREWRLPGLLYADDLVMCGVSEEDLRAMVGRFVEVSRRKSLKANCDKSIGMLLNGEKGLKFELYTYRILMEYVSEFKYLGCFGRIRYR